MNASIVYSFFSMWDHVTKTCVLNLTEPCSAYLHIVRFSLNEAQIFILVALTDRIHECNSFAGFHLLDSIVRSSSRPLSRKQLKIVPNAGLQISRTHSINRVALLYLQTRNPFYTPKEVLPSPRKGSNWMGRFDTRENLICEIVKNLVSIWEKKYFFENETLYFKCYLFANRSNQSDI